MLIRASLRRRRLGDPQTRLAISLKFRIEGLIAWSTVIEGHIVQTWSKWYRLLRIKRLHVVEIGRGDRLLVCFAFYGAALLLHLVVVSRLKLEIILGIGPS